MHMPRFKHTKCSQQKLQAYLELVGEAAAWCDGALNDILNATNWTAKSKHDKGLGGWFNTHELHTYLELVGEAAA